MQNINFKCRACKEYVKIKKEVIGSFSDWAYDCAEWSDFGEDVPELSEKHWERSENIPVVGESRSIFVCEPFDEKIGGEFNILFEPALLYFNDWEYCPDDIDKCAIVYCKLEKVLISDEYSAWIRVEVKDVILLSELCKKFKEVKSIEDPEEILKFKEEVYFKNDRWLITGWSAQGDAGETKWIYTDDKGEKHLVMNLVYSFHESILYIGNVVCG